VRSKSSVTVASLNSVIFGEDDTYSDPAALQEDSIGYRILYEGDTPVAYVMWQLTESPAGQYLECLRRGVLKEHRGKGLGVALTKGVIRRAKKLGIPYWTYADRTNIPSINSSIKAGMKIYFVEKDQWVQLIWRPEVKNAIK